MRRAARLTSGLRHLFNFKDRAFGVKDSLVYEAWPLGVGTIQELTRVVTLAPSGGNLTGYVLDLATDVEWIPEQLCFELAALCPERE